MQPNFLIHNQPCLAQDDTKLSQPRHFYVEHMYLQQSSNRRSDFLLSFWRFTPSLIGPLLFFVSRWFDCSALLTHKIYFQPPEYFSLFMIPHFDLFIFYFIFDIQTVHLMSIHMLFRFGPLNEAFAFHRFSRLGLP